MAYFRQIPDQFSISAQVCAQILQSITAPSSGPAMPWANQLELLKTNLLALGARRLAALAFAAASVIAVVSTIGYFASRPETEPLYVGLTQSDVSRIGMALSEAGVPFDVNPDGSKIYVRRAHAPRARMLLAERGLPAGGTAGYELFDKLSPLGLTSFMQDVSRNRALEGELARTIQTMKGITSARVHIVSASSSSFQRNQPETTASVMIRLSGPAAPAGAAPIIRHLVAAAVPGLAPEHVSVMSTDGSLLATAGDSEGAGSQRMIELEQALARRTQENVRRTLAPYLGIENFEVSAVARVNMDRHQLQEQTWDPDSKAERSTRTIKEQSSA
ncbi:MAG: flagellar M-ring protein FliF, partial [Proteobacteria bacterium]|nr:flagellar M-ring protein FliF [Pseudomonadota bacterium]